MKAEALEAALVESWKAVTQGSQIEYGHIGRYQDWTSRLARFQ